MNFYVRMFCKIPLFFMCGLFLFLFILLTSCSLYDTPELPDLNKESFSYDSVMDKKKFLMKKRQNILNENSENNIIEREVYNSDSAVTLQNNYLKNKK